MVSRSAFGIGLYGTISVALFATIVEKGFTAPFFTSVPLAILNGALLFLNISISERFENRYARKQEDHSWCPYFWTMTFAIGAVMGFVACWCVQELYWNMHIAVVLWAGIYSFSHGISHGVKIYKSQLKNTNPKDFKHSQIYIEWLKLEHDFIQTSFRSLVSLLSVLVIGGIVGYFLYVGDPWGPGMQDTVIVTIWGIVGLWFGILGPFQEIMYDLRNKIRELAI